MRAKFGVGGAILALLVLPPWRAAGAQGLWEGHSLVFLPPHGYSRVAWDILLVECAAASLLAFGVVEFVNRRSAESPTSVPKPRRAWMPSLVAVAVLVGGYVAGNLLPIGGWIAPMQPPREKPATAAPSAPIGDPAASLFTEDALTQPVKPISFDEVMNKPLLADVYAEKARRTAESNPTLSALYAEKARRLRVAAVGGTAAPGLTVDQEREVDDFVAEVRAKRIDDLCKTLKETQRQLLPELRRRAGTDAHKLSLVDELARRWEIDPIETRR